MTKDTTVKCKRCNGTGAITVNNITGERKTCPSCGGAGVVSLQWIYAEEKMWSMW